jgi:hypothetical protein
MWQPSDGPQPALRHVVADADGKRSIASRRVGWSRNNSKMLPTYRDPSPVSFASSSRVLASPRSRMPCQRRASSRTRTILGSSGGFGAAVRGASPGSAPPSASSCFRRHWSARKHERGLQRMQLDCRNGRVGARSHWLASDGERRAFGASETACGGGRASAPPAAARRAPPAAARRAPPAAGSMHRLRRINVDGAFGPNDRARLRRIR